MFSSSLNESLSVVRLARFIGNLNRCLHWEPICIFLDWSLSQCRIFVFIIAGCILYFNVSCVVIPMIYLNLAYTQCLLSLLLYLNFSICHINSFSGDHFYTPWKRQYLPISNTFVSFMLDGSLSAWGCRVVYSTKIDRFSNPVLQPLVIAPTGLSTLRVFIIP